jgi:hypothetical protein
VVTHSLTLVLNSKNLSLYSDIEINGILLAFRIV